MLKHTVLKAGAGAPMIFDSWQVADGQDVRAAGEGRLQLCMICHHSRSDGL